MTDVAVAWDATKHPRDTGSGRFAEAHHSAPEADLSTVMPDFSSVINDSYPVPQADRLESIIATVIAIDADINTPSAAAQALGMDDRQGAYYLNAAGYLGLAEADRGYEGGSVWTLTALGQEMAALDDNERCALIAAIAESTPAVAGFRGDGLGGAGNAIAEVSELGDETIARRAATAQSWATSIDDRNFVRDTDTICDEARVRFAAAAERAKQERSTYLRASAPKAAELCTTCFLELPLTGECMNCG